MQLNCFSVDLEDYFQVNGFESAIDREEWSEFESHLATGTHRILDALDDAKAQATFFVVGWTAERFPELISEIVQRGHEIGSHSFWHKLLPSMTPSEFRTDLRDSIKVISDVTQKPVQLFRAPSFSLTPKAAFVREILVEEGITIDSSVIPKKTKRGGYPGCPAQPHRVMTAAGMLTEFPVVDGRFFGARIPVCGGGYFRLFPAHWIHKQLHAINRAGHPFTFYIHPWELVPEQPRLGVGGLANRFRHYVNLSKSLPKLRRLLADFNFANMSQTIGAIEEDLPVVAV